MNGKRKIKKGSEIIMKYFVDEKEVKSLVFYTILNEVVTEEIYGNLEEGFDDFKKINKSIDKLYDRCVEELKSGLEVIVGTTSFRMGGLKNNMQYKINFEVVSQDKFEAILYNTCVDNNLNLEETYQILNTKGMVVIGTFVFESYYMGM